MVFKPVVQDSDHIAVKAALEAQGIEVNEWLESLSLEMLKE